MPGEATEKWTKGAPASMPEYPGEMSFEEFATLFNEARGALDASKLSTVREIENHLRRVGFTFVIRDGELLLKNETVKLVNY